MTLTTSAVHDLLEPYCREIPPLVCDKILMYMDLLSIWGEKVALTAINNEQEVVRFHFGESIFALSLQSFENGRLADVGSGAGFPGLAIKLLRPNLHVTLIEPNKKKCAFLNEVIRKLDLGDAEVLPTSFVSSKIRREQLMYVTARALGGIEELLSWSKASLSPIGHVFLWLGEKHVERTMHASDWHWSRTPIPGTVRRKILIGTRAL
ncbi:MAG TPA: 16S rRNA (guanine(527)-N(7))-methyltransferase RsmG [Candidatus Acidoferrales bacterium]|nr:16S rRNA (guanine(527)-N(7))-methyltransferase RsmG [Candidatus Acidoferrales bacterium]